jgi:hydroxysqualene dehydroxylase
LSSTESCPRIIIVGGGLAGMAAAVALESAGLKITLIEARRQLGGRAGSFEDPQTGEILDNCQHVLLGCCTNLIDFYRRIGSLDQIHFERTIRFAGPDGRPFGLHGMRGLPAPLHLAAAFASFGILTLKERTEVARAMLAILRLGKSEFTALADVRFGTWLDQHGQSEQTVHKLYDPIVISGLNEQTRDAGAAWAIKIFRDALLTNSRGFLFGLPACPLGKLYERLTVSDLRLGARMSELSFDAGRVSGVKTADGQTLSADALILATNHHTLRQWIPDEFAVADARLANLDKLQSVPILGVHLWFDQPVMRTSHLALVEGPLQWLFRKDAEGRVVHGVISAARDWIGIPRERSLQLFEEQIRAVLPRAPTARLVRGVVVIEKRATFSPLPGVDRLRPTQAPPPGGIENLFLAGDYTQTGWPATMEGAVRSGYLAADAVLRFVAPKKHHQTFLASDLSSQWPARLLGGSGRSSLSSFHFSSGRNTSTAAK